MTHLCFFVFLLLFPFVFEYSVISVLSKLICHKESMIAIATCFYFFL